ncbi:L-asparaginase [Acetitomaculum ruminis DSM 5522]|uniref:asparaginase n=1 Tax=Acetitomaculum ruminis DSM 5522 TaxID=1120918 RepID=A0A1I0ZWC9_9FIRM|nr:asparaginase [Acetitomaculum ruminis]SFB29871.1 L-asparaginase [Acetitomaculum ruminis DSM 5522]
MKKVLLIATGGTIASRKGTGGLTPQISPEDLLKYIEPTAKRFNIDTITPFNLDSTNVTPKHWEELALCIKNNYEKYDGFVITHGTDTLAYTAAALSYMIQNSNKPIIITGAQKPIDFDDTDARNNLSDSIIYAADDKSRGVVIVFDGKVIAATRAKKVRTKSYNAFSSINYPFLAAIFDGKIIRYIPCEEYSESLKIYTKINKNVCLLKLIPGMDEKLLKLMFESYDGIIIESFGVGGVPDYIKDTFIDLCKKYSEKMVVMATQVTHEGSDMAVYEVGADIKEKLTFFETHDMTLESALAKTMWILENKDDLKREEIFYKTINYDILMN